ncbi:hypothetical protein [Metallosphaera cuprina]|uniref:Uncharacterized protein n=1 Tax=Metallosphaera cuprina (strain Ar-4) TaxID=1006006 RepID=F4G3K6_METCR|nr:hypothetical protein [Metallosphaera cuprina]AEB95376.1 conserved hypothetical protein [Metallosphaera cuprina Ar-4]
MSKKKNDNSKGRVLLPVNKRHELELKEIMKQMIDRGYLSKTSDWKSFIDEAIESLITLVKVSPEHSFAERVEIFRDLYSSKLMGLVPFPLNSLQEIIEKYPEFSNEIVSIYFSLFKHNFLIDTPNNISEMLSLVKRFFIAITPLPNAQNVIVKQNGSCGTFIIFASYFGKNLSERVYLPLLRSILDEIKAEVKSLKGDNITIEAVVCTRS